MCLFTCVSANVCSGERCGWGKPRSSLPSFAMCPSRHVIRTHESSLALIASKDPEERTEINFESSFLLSRYSNSTARDRVEKHCCVPRYALLKTAKLANSASSSAFLSSLKNDAESHNHPNQAQWKENKELLTIASNCNLWTSSAKVPSVA